MLKEDIKDKIKENLKVLSCKKLDNATKQEIFNAVAFLARDLVSDNWIKTRNVYNIKNPKILCYLSMEFLMGRFLGNTLINLSLDNDFEKALKDFDIDYNLLEESEKDPGLGNGGLGRLAACFLDSLSTLEFPAYGYGIRYHYGIFEQHIKNGYQIEKFDNWLENGDPFGVRRTELSQEVKFFGHVVSQIKPNGSYRFYLENYQLVNAVPYDYPVVGYDNSTVNTLRLWDSEAKNKFDLQSFNAGNYSKAVEEQNLAETISEVLYPADNHILGKELRLKQQYFFISATLQEILKNFLIRNNDFEELSNKVALQLNDTHPSIAIAELMRLLIDEYNVDWEKAWKITRKTCAYTNHTIMSEALEKWPVDLFSRLLPRIYMIIEEINKRFCDNLSKNFVNNHEKIKSMSIIYDNQVRMANLAIIGSHSVNGVARLHTEILKKRELSSFYDIYPEKFNNKTNGITQRRWLAHANPELANLITEKISDEWLTNLESLRELKKFINDKNFCDEFNKVKENNKIKLANFIYKTQNILVDHNFIFDVQIKRLHEYKRQSLNILHILYLYNQIKTNPDFDFEPTIFIFSAKSAANYHRAKLIIKLINSVADLINNDKFASDKIKIVFVPNYCVSLAEKIIPAANISQQISTAGKEASGTGNMKFMLNGAITLGTLDGANIEILEEVGEKNIYIFGLTADQINEYKKNNSYNPKEIFNNNQNIRLILTQLINGTLDKDTELFREIYESLINFDEYFILRDFESYKNTYKKINFDYKDKHKWTKSAIMNTSCSGKFSSDRTIKEYAKDIWNLKKININ
ncbi:MAG: glycogen/starch/alpha-glucan phosphorylase [Clostridiales bacterium]|jgi:starch phosphorylase|nr:glycogen/starch/alpha-glucan phosphorylase [Clostridiales bacterium]